MTVIDKLFYTGAKPDLQKDISEAAAALKQSAKEIASQIKQSYNNKIKPAMTGGVEGAGLTGASFLNQLGLTGLATSYKERRETQEKERMGIYGPPAPETAASSEKLEDSQKEKEDIQSAITTEKEDEANKIREEQLKIQQRTSDDLMSLYVITDDYQKKMIERSEKILESLEIVAQNGGTGGGSLLDVADLAKSGGKGGAAAKGGMFAKLAGGFKGAMAGGGATIAAGAAMVAAPFAADAGLNALGYGNKSIDEKQDEDNWKRMSVGQKFQSGMARGLEKLGGLFGGTIANEARADRIKKETEYLDKTSGVSNAKEIKEENAEQEIQFSEEKFAEKDPENYAKFKEFENKKIEELVAKDPFVKAQPNVPQVKQSARRNAEKQARREAINKFKKEIEAAGAGSVKGAALQKNNDISENQKTQKSDQIAENKANIQKEVTAISKDSGIGKKTIEQLAMEEARKFGRSTPNRDDMAAAQMAYRKQALDGKSEGELSGVSTLPATNADRVAEKTASLKDQESAMQKKEQANSSPVVNNTNVVSNQTAEKPKVKDTKNNETTFQKYLDRRYYPAT